MFYISILFFIYLVKLGEALYIWHPLYNQSNASLNDPNLILNNPGFYQKKIFFTQDEPERTQPIIKNSYIEILVGCLLLAGIGFLAFVVICKYFLIPKNLN